MHSVGAVQVKGRGLDSASGDSDAAARLAYLREELLTLRDAYRMAAWEYRNGPLSLAQEIAQITALNGEIYAIVAEIVALTRPAALLKQGE